MALVAIVLVKEHTLITIMAGVAQGTAYATNIITGSSVVELDVSLQLSDLVFA